MLVKTRGIVLNHIKYGETSIVVHIYTEELGRQSYIVNSVRTPKKKNLLALLQPLTLLDLEVYHKNGDKVDAGTPLLKLDLAMAETDVKKAEDEVAMKNK